MLEENYPEVNDVVSARTARIMVSMLREVVLHGTGAAASKLNHPLGGKTGTTNDFTDAWFVGFSPSLTCGVWVGFDEKKTLGNKETGARPRCRSGWTSCAWRCWDASRKISPLLRRCTQRGREQAGYS